MVNLNNMKKCLIYVFSGTGNTALAANNIAKYLTQYGYETTVYRIKAPYADVPSGEDFDLVGFGYPIHAFNAPEVFVKFIKKLPKLTQRTRAFIFKVSGEPYHLNDASSLVFSNKLRKKGFDVVLEKHLIMPYNIMFRYPDGVAKQMYLYLDALSELIAKKLSLGEIEIMHYGFWHSILSFFLRIEWIAPKLNCFFVHIDRSKCTSCHSCIKNCPTQSMFINKKGKIRVNHSCAMCMSCTYSCPTNAIQFGFMNNWKVNGPFNYVKICNDDSIPSDYVNRNTKDYFRHFKNYFYEQNILLKKYDIRIPVEYNADEILLSEDEDNEYQKAH